jgi:hypothetical protein
MAAQFSRDRKGWREHKEENHEGVRERERERESMGWPTGSRKEGRRRLIKREEHLVAPHIENSLEARDS